MKITILHISDLHIGNTNCHENDIKNNLIQALDDANDKSIDYIIVTGDIIDAEKNKEEQQQNNLNRAVQFFEELIKGINQIQGKKIGLNQILFVPGNHDINRQNGSWELYQSFLQTFYSCQIPECYDKNMQTMIKICEEDKILFIGLNSNYFNRDEKKFKECVDTAQLNKVNRLFKEHQGFPNYYTIVFLHHPFYLFTESEGNIENGIISNAENFSAKLAKWNTRLVFHGHKHYDRQSVIKPIGSEKINVFSAASIGKKGVQDHAVNIVEIEKNPINGGKIKLELFKLIAKDSEEFKLDQEPIKELDQGLLYERIPKYETELKQQRLEFKYILGILNQLYLLYEPLNLLYYQKTYLKLLLYGITYRIAVKERDTKKKQKLKERLENNLSTELTSTLSIIYSLLEEPDKNKITLDKKITLELENDVFKKRCVSFCLLVIFFTDLYFDLKEFWDLEFIIIDGVKVNAEYIIRYDFNYGYLFLTIKCRNANDHKKALQIVNEYREFSEKICEFFSCIKLKIKNIIPEIVSYDDDNEINFYDFKASIPQLIPLLTGKNIYSSDTVFVRELTQNAIDAISFREKLEHNKQYSDKLKKIDIDIGQDNEGSFFRIRDYGIGMQEEIIERYFTTLGKSYYREYDDVRKGEIKYNAISNFGIGFLSAFRPCKKIIIKTKSYKEDIYHKLEILDKQDYFLIYSGENSEFQTGTEITCYFKDEAHSLTGEEVHSYLQRIMLDIKYPIYFSNDLPGINSRAIRRLCSHIRGVIFIPFDEETGKIGVIEDYQEILSEIYIEKYRHGMLIRPKLKENSKDINVLNAGMLMEETKLLDIFSAKSMDLYYNQVYVNFPPNWLDIDISREKATTLCSKDIDDIKEKILHSFLHQEKQYCKYWKCASLAEVLEMEEFIECLCSPKEPIVTCINLLITFQKNAITFQIRKSTEHNNGNPKVKYIYEYETPDSERIHKYLIQAYQENLNIETLSEIQRMSQAVYYTDENAENNHINKFLNRLGLDINGSVNLSPIVLAACLPEKKNPISNNTSIETTLRLVEKTLLEKNNINDLDSPKLFYIIFDEKLQAHFEVDTDNLEKIVKNIADIYGVPTKEINRIDKHDFIWDKIIYNKFQYYFEAITTNEWNQIRQEGKQLYESLKNKMKLHIASEKSEAKIDVYMIASCYMGSLLKIKTSYPSRKERVINDPKNRWILDVSIEIINMWKLSEFRKQAPDKYEKLNQLRINDNEANYGNRYRKYLQLLSLEETQDNFKVWLFSELMSWIGFYMEMKLL